MLNEITLFDGLLKNIRPKDAFCTCDVHDNELIQQIDAELPNGIPVRILKDSYGFHVVIGRDQIASGKFPLEVSQEVAEEMIREAIQDCY